MAKFQIKNVHKWLWLTCRSSVIHFSLSFSYLFLPSRSTVLHTVNTQQCVFSANTVQQSISNYCDNGLVVDLIDQTKMPHVHSEGVSWSFGNVAVYWKKIFFFLFNKTPHNRFCSRDRKRSKCRGGREGDSSREKAILSFFNWIKSQAPPWPSKLTNLLAHLSGHQRGFYCDT